MSGFIKLIERMDWEIPCRVRLSVDYDAETTWIDKDTGEAAGGILNCCWRVAEVFDADGRQLEWPGCHAHVALALEAEAGFDEEVLGYCDEDFAHRKTADWD